MNTISNNIRALGLAFAVALFALTLSFAVVPTAHAVWDDVGDYIPFGDFGGDYGGWYTDYAIPYSDYMNYGGDYGGWYTDYAIPYSDYMDYGGGYGSGFPMSYGGSGFGGGFPFSYGGGGQGFSLTNVNQNQNQNTCTAGSCNTNTSINAPTTVSTISYPQPTYQQPTYYPTYQPTYQPTYYPTYQQPNRTPYVSLSAVPYTGLDLGPWGTAAYWSFLVLWCLVAAYLIAIKKIHYRIANWFMGSTPVATVSHRAPKVEVTHEVAKAPAVQLSGIDPFIASQINRLSR